LRLAQQRFLLDPPPCSVAPFKVNSEPHNGARPSFRLGVGRTNAASKLGPAHKRTEGRAPVLGSEFTTKAAKPHGDSKESLPSPGEVGLIPVLTGARAYRAAPFMRPRLYSHTMPSAITVPLRDASCGYRTNAAPRSSLVCCSLATRRRAPPPPRLALPRAPPYAQT
jgi:hypothetical protein